MASRSELLFHGGRASDQTRPQELFHGGGASNRTRPQPAAASKRRPRRRLASRGGGAQETPRGDKEETTRREERHGSERHEAAPVLPRFHLLSATHTSDAAAAAISRRHFLPAVAYRRRFRDGTRVKSSPPQDPRGNLPQHRTFPQLSARRDRAAAESGAAPHTTRTARRDADGAARLPLARRREVEEIICTPYHPAPSPSPAHRAGRPRLDARARARPNKIRPGPNAR